MEQQEPPETSRDPAEQPDAARDALRALEARLDRASEAAERLFAEAAARGGRARSTGSTDAPPADSETPPAGWQAPEDASAEPTRDLDLLVSLVQSVRDLIPPELQRRVADALRELLLALRALIDWYLERVERRRAEPAEVQDIPIQ